MRDLHALAGVFPVGVFLVVHILTNARALSGQAAFDGAVGFWDGLPLAWLLELVLVLAPLAFHAGYGVVLMLRPRALADSPYPADWRVVVRGAAWVSLVFIAYHAYAMGMAKYGLGIGARSLHTAVAAHLSAATGSATGLLMPWTAILYLVGLAATTTHFAAGTWSYLVRTKRTPTQDARRRAAYGTGAAGLVLFALSSSTVIGFATGSPLFPPAAAASPCPLPPLPAPASPAASAPAPPAAPAASH
jgi:succinate dehydrogenase / fumarate reductase, cytochrome b subunit